MWKKREKKEKEETKKKQKKTDPNKLTHTFAQRINAKSFINKIVGQRFHSVNGNIQSNGEMYWRDEHTKMAKERSHKNQSGIEMKHK